MKTNQIEAAVRCASETLIIARAQLAEARMNVTSDIAQKARSVAYWGREVDRLTAMAAQAEER